MNTPHNRIKKYSQIAAELASSSDSGLSNLLDKAKPMHSGIGGKSVLLTINGTPVFVKKIPLSDLERQPDNIMSTANLFDLPLHYQYGVGSAGFSAWRELATHLLATNWVISGESPNFPLLYHWRILPNSKSESMNAEQLKKLDQDVAYWENSQAIRTRLEAIHNASAYIALFLEYVPQNLHQWLKGQLAKDDETSELAVAFVEENLKLTNSFMNERGLMHFDAHFENILTDGDLLYFSDFGLALSSKFELTKAETEFLNYHYNYDRCCAAVNLLHCLITSFFGKSQWETRLKDCLNNEKAEISTKISAVIKRYAPIALAMDEFFQKLQKSSKRTPYPAAHLQTLLAKIEQVES